MNRLPMSSAAGAVLRALIGKAAVQRDRILLTEATSTDWQSLTFAGERHQLALRIPAPDAKEIAARMCDDLSEAEFNIPGVIVADIALLGSVEAAADGSATLIIEALTIASD